MSGYVFATKLSGRKGDGKVERYTGTTFYKAPEIREKKPFAGFAADIFSLGVLLFVLFTKEQPFKEASNKDPLYAHIIDGDYASYWEQWTKINDITVPPTMRDLFNGIFAYPPAVRMTTAEILMHDWVVSTPKPTDANVEAFIKTACNLP